MLMVLGCFILSKSDRDQLVFWCVRDTTVHGGINGIDIPSTIGQSSAAVNRSLKKKRSVALSPSMVFLNTANSKSLGMP